MRYELSNDEWATRLDNSGNSLLASGLPSAPVGQAKSLESQFDGESPGPTTHSGGCGDFLYWLRKAADWRASCTTAWSLRPLICGSGDVLTLFSPPWKSRFPATESAVGRDWVRRGSYCAESPSIWCWRDHSAGRSARRTTPMPCGSRPSIAALTRSGAGKASEIFPRCGESLGVKAA
jgi:hypothetical protein